MTFLSFSHSVSV